MFETQFLGPVAVHYRNPQDEARLVIFEPEAHGLEESLGDFHWDNFPTPEKPIKYGSPNWDCPHNAPEIGFGPFVTDEGRAILWTLKQERLDFLFTTTGNREDLWRVLTSYHAPSVVTLTQLHGRRGYYDSTPGRFLSDRDALEIFEVNSENRWHVGNPGNERLPFRVRSLIVPVKSVDIP